MAERLTPEKLPVGRNTLLLSAGMAALYGMVQLWAAVTPITFEVVTGLEGLVGLGPAIFMSTAALAALPAGRAMDRLGRVPVLAGGFALGILGCVLVGLGASLLSVVGVVFGLVLIGASYGTVMLSRAAAADMYQPERRARGIALVLFGAAFGAIGFMALGLVLILNVRPAPSVSALCWLRDPAKASPALRQGLLPWSRSCAVRGSWRRFLQPWRVFR